MPPPPPPFSDGRYVPVRRLGSGGMAEVWEVEDTRLGVHRALKVLPAGEASDTETRARLVQEARILARLSHPHIVRVLDVGEEPDGRAWLVMELVPGGTLEGWIDRNGPLHPREAGRVLLGVLDALGSAHAAGVIHRDVKPQNLLVATDAGGSARLQLADFGIARLRDAQDLTRTGTLMGSWALMAPEQRLDARHVGPASDLFAAAGTLVWMVHGSAVSDLHVQEHRTALMASWPPTLAGVCHRALAFRPEQRFHSAGAFAEALRFALAQEGELAEVRAGSRPWAEGGFEVALADGALAGTPAEVAGSSVDSWDGGGSRPLRNASPGAGRAGMSRVRVLAWAVAACAVGATIGAVAGDANDVLEQVGVVEVPDGVRWARFIATTPACDAPQSWTYSQVPRRIEQSPTLREAGEALLADVDADGHMDVLIPHMLDAAVRIYWGTGERIMPTGFTDVPTERMWRGSRALAVGDLDGDGVPDLLYPRYDASGLAWVRQATTRTFEAPNLIDQAEYPSDVWLVDANDDGRKDALILLRQAARDNLILRPSAGAGVFGDAIAIATDVTTVAPLAREGGGLWLAVARGPRVEALTWSPSDGLRRVAELANVPDNALTQVWLTHLTDQPHRAWLRVSSSRSDVFPSFIRFDLSSSSISPPCKVGKATTNPSDLGDFDGDGVVDLVSTATSNYGTSSYALDLGERIAAQ